MQSEDINNKKVEATEPPKSGIPNPIPVTPIGSDPSQTVLFAVPPPPSSLPEVSKETPIQPSSQSLNRWVIAIAVVVVLLIIAMVIRKSNSSPIPAPEPLTQTSAEAQAGTETEGNAALPQKPPKAEQWQTRDIDDAMCWGIGQVLSAAEKPLVSAEVDAEIVAIGDALKLRVERLFAPTASRWRNGTRSTTSGAWKGFFIRYIVSELPPEEATKELTITTPGKASIRIQNGALISMKNTDLDRLKNELTAAGIDVARNPGGEKKGEVTVNLHLQVFSQIAGDYLIQSDRVGNIRVGAPVAILESVIPKAYFITQKKVLIGRRFFNIYKIHDDKSNPLLFVYENEVKVMGISPISDLYKTAKGIGIGSPLFDLLQCYGKVRFSYLPGQRVIANVESEKVQFYLDEKLIDFQRNFFSPDARIDSILVGEAPKEEENQ